MTILLYNDGRLVIDDGNPIEGNSLEGLVACVSDPQSGDTLKFDGKQWVAGAAASGLPAVSGTDNGKVLTVVEGAWAPAAGGGGGGGLVVEVTKSGDLYTMGKTAREIMAAFSEGTSVVCHFPDATWYADQYSPVVAVYSNIDYDSQQVSTCDVHVWFQGNDNTFTSPTRDDYPTLSFE